MGKQELTRAAAGAFTRFGESANKAIAIYRESGERIAALAGERWDIAFEQSRSQLDAETRRNAKHFRVVMGSWWERAFALSADGAQAAVDTMVGAAVAGIERVAAQ